VFDVDLHPKPKDRLLLCLQVRLEDNTLGQYNYGFQYKKGKWVHCEYHYIEWMWKHIEEKGGNVKNHPISSLSLSVLPTEVNILLLIAVTFLRTNNLHVY
jgi:hypothetical protein